MSRHHSILVEEFTQDSLIMENRPNRYRYFESLETTIRFALAVYVTVFVAGIICTTISVDTIAALMRETGVVVLLISVFVIGGLFIGLYYIIGKIHWLGELHIRLDQKLFGFLLKSNDTIFTTLITALPLKEQQRFHDMHTDAKGALAQTIFNTLPNDLQVFDGLLGSGIFRLWITYWATIYGTSTFAALTIVSFIAAWLRPDHYGKLFFGMNWGLALLHLAVALFMGRLLVGKTKNVVQGIVVSHEDEIASVLKNSAG
jgi:hypothetical protein